MGDIATPTGLVARAGLRSARAAYLFCCPTIAARFLLVSSTTIPTIVAVAGVVTPGVTALGGYLLAGFNEEKRDERQAAREQDARDAERKARLRDRNHDFQREVLLGLQEQGRRLTRVSLQVINHDLRALEQRGEVGRVPQDLDQEALDAGAAYLQAVNRVTNDGLRDHLREFYTLAVNASTLNDLTPAQAKAKLESSRQSWPLSTSKRMTPSVTFFATSCGARSSRAASL